MTKTEPGKHADYLGVITQGVTIYAEDASFAIAAGEEPIDTPFRPAWPAYDFETLLGKYQEFADHGAKRVRVRYPGHDKPLYGLLSLMGINAGAVEFNVRRTYRIEVPAERVAAAQGGLVQVIYRPYDWKRSADPLNNRFARSRSTAKGRSAAWALWLSDAPFCGHRRDWIEPAR